MSANNHDNGDINNVRYAKKESPLTFKDEKMGILLHLYANTMNKPFTEWLKWMDEYGYTVTKQNVKKI